MTITPKQLAKRRANIGGSDVAAILNIHPHTTAANVAISKIWPTEDAGNEAMDLGTDLEEGLITFAESDLGKIRRGGERRVEGTPILVHTDGVVVDSGRPVEAKTVGLLNPWSPAIDQWGDAGTDHVPAYVLVQVMAQIAACDVDAGHVSALLCGRGRKLFHIERDDELIAVIRRVVIRFDEEYIRRGVVPGPEWGDMCAPSLQAAKAIVRIPDSVVDLDAQTARLTAEWENTKATLNYMKKREEMLKAALLTSLGDAEAGKLPDGRMLEYRASTRQEKAREARTSTVRTLRTTKGL